MTAFVLHAGEDCPSMGMPDNGGMQCTGPQITGESCSFSCDPGYSLTGSSVRSCLPNNEWSGEEALCSPLRCPELEAPTNALLVSPCSNTFESSCTVVCDRGYHVTNSSNEYQWIQSCVLHNENQTVQWTATQSCTGKCLCIIHQQYSIEAY